MNFFLSVLTAYTATSAAITIRKRLPGTYSTSAAATAAGIQHLKQHPNAVGFQIELEGLEAANDAAMHRQTITRATAARKARQQRKQQEVKAMTTTGSNDATQGEFASLVAAFRQRGHVLRQVSELHTGKPTYYASAWGYCKPLASLDEVRAFLQQIGGRPHAASD